MRVVHSPVNTAGIPWQNVQALRRRGVDASLVVFERYRLHPEADVSLDRHGSFAHRQLQQRAPLFRREVVCRQLVGTLRGVQSDAERERRGRAHRGRSPLPECGCRRAEKRQHRASDPGEHCNA